MPTKPKNLIGYCTCPECGFTDAEIKTDKNGCAYRFCPDCNAQYFARTPERDSRLRAKMRPVEPEKTPATLDKALEVGAAAPKKSASVGTLLG